MVAIHVSKSTISIPSMAKNEQHCSEYVLSHSQLENNTQFLMIQGIIFGLKSFHYSCQSFRF